jgi:hypothetical protein
VDLGFFQLPRQDIYRTLGLDPAIREALEEGVSRPAEIIPLEKRKRVNDLNF